MSYAIDNLMPEPMWRYFEEISCIPRGSGDEKRVAGHIVKVARSLGMQVRQDKVLNTVITKPASPGRENAPSVCLQGHLDMVCEKNLDKIHDFKSDPIKLIRSGEWITAEGTTLGADNGIGAAAALAVMSDRSIEHGPLEFLFTVDEETGLTGAQKLKGDFVKSRILINLDTEEEGTVYVGCAGGQTTTASWKVVWEKAPARALPFLLSVRGLKGGHSGLEINAQHGNAVKILTRALNPLVGLGARVASIDGGNKHNAIPREAAARIFLPKDKSRKAKAEIAKTAEAIRAELASIDGGLTISLDTAEAQKGAKVMKAETARRVLDTLQAVPHGVVKMSPDIADLVQTSMNLAVVKTEKGSVTAITSQRSSVASELQDIAFTAKTVFGMGGAKTSSSGGYPGWKPNLDSPILNITKVTHRQLFGTEPRLKAVHAGLECGLIGEKYPGMDMVAFGPTIKGAHSPEERVHISSAGNFFKLLVGVLKNVH